MKDARYIFFIVVLTTAGFMATDIYLPSMPAITEYFQTTNTYVQFTMPAFLLTFGLAPLIFGPISDQIGRRKVILGCLALSIIATILCSFAPNIWVLILCRVLQGMGFGAVNISARAMIPDLYQGPEMARLHSMVNVFFPIVISVAPPIGGYIQENYGWQMVFIALSIYILFLLTITALKLPETNKQAGSTLKQNPLHIYTALLKIPAFCLYGFIPALIMAGVMAFLTLTPYYFQLNLGLSPFQYGLTAVANCASLIIGAMINTQLIKKYAPRQILYMSVFIILSASILLFFFIAIDFLTIFTVLPCCLAYFFSMVLIFPSAFVSAFSYVKKNYGAASALIMSVQMMFSLLISALVSFLPDDTILPLAIVFLFISIGIFSILKITKPLAVTTA